MIRLISILAGLGFAIAALWSFGKGAYVVMTEGMGEQSAEYALHEKVRGPEGGFSFEGPVGNWDRQQLQRGYQPVGRCPASIQTPARRLRVQACLRINSRHPIPTALLLLRPITTRSHRICR